MNRSCRPDSVNGYQGCDDNFVGSCINGTVACGSCSQDELCTTPDNKTRLDWQVPVGGKILLELPDACMADGLIIEA